MLRLFIGLVILSSCSMGTIKSGGEETFSYDPKTDYSSSDLRDLSSKIVTTLKREPPVGKLRELFHKNQKPLKRVGIIIFESEIQPTRSGLSGKNEIYLSEQGKQILTENFLSIWEQSFQVLGKEIEFVKTAKFKSAASFSKYGNLQEDFVKTKRSTVAPDDIFFLESGKKTTTSTVLNPRGMRDVSFVLVPAYDLMGGPKWSEHNKHFINDVSKELSLDAVIIVMSQVSWTSAHTDKHSGEHFEESLNLKLLSSVLIPLHSYHERLSKLSVSDLPGVNLCYRSYESQLKIPVKITYPSEKKVFTSIENELLLPLFKSYKDLTQMTVLQMSQDMKASW